MALPAKGDPRRPLLLAIRSARILGIIALLFAGCVAYLSVLMMAAHVGAGGPLGLAALAVLYGAGGGAFLVFASYLKQRRYWAVVACLVLSSFLLLFSVLGAAGVLFQRARGQNVSTLRLFVVFLAVAAFAQLVYHLCQSLEAIKYVPVEEKPGFEPVMALPDSPPAPLPPAEPGP
ncbi:MAG TPA: hypothetical protein VHY37_08020 [Tepidisphaeraceae bacterium]|jgi:hypothetical protein|nr:hypothetical protein [Tepidisphaeraceae bacterium]